MSQEAKSREFDDLDDLCIRTIGVFCADVVEKAKSGHPGAPMGLSSVSHILWTKYLNASKNRIIRNKSLSLLQVYFKLSYKILLRCLKILLKKLMKS